jgi:alpha-N-acetylglucosamine transferase
MPITKMLDPLRTNPKFRSSGFRIAFAAFIFVIAITYFLLPLTTYLPNTPDEISPEETFEHDLPPSFESIDPKYDPDRDVSGEKYMTLLAPSQPHPWDEGNVDHYFETVTIMAHRLIHHEATRDPLNREFIVLATEHVKPKQIEILKSLGAVVRHVGVLGPPSNVNPDHVYDRWKDQYTKLLMWNMTEYTRIVYIDADAMIIKPISELFDLAVEKTTQGEEWLFASVYDAAPAKGFGSYPEGIPELGPEDKWGHDLFSGGQFVLMPTQKQADYIYSIYNNPPDVDFLATMEQSFLRYCYRDDGPYPWMRLSQIYNTQWPRGKDMKESKVVHEKSWHGGPHDVPELREEWTRGWAEVQGYLALKMGIDEYAKEAHPISHNN